MIRKIDRRSSVSYLEYEESESNKSKPITFFEKNKVKVKIENLDEYSHEIWLVTKLGDTQQLVKIDLNIL